jgi:hypothetical protein
MASSGSAPRQLRVGKVRKTSAARVEIDGSLEIENFCFGGQINKVRSSVEHHIGEESGLVDLTSLCTRDSDLMPLT